MNMLESDKNRIKFLVAEMNKYRDSYYNQNTSIISDEQYDKLFDELEKLETATGIVYANSPTQNVGYESVSKLKKVKHNHKLLSLGKTTELDDVKKYFGNKEVVVMAKMDGLTASITYENGVLVRAESRGNGEVGEDITHNALVFQNLPKKIPFKGKLVVDGECIITYDTFAEINDRENTEYKNPRNLASGTVRQLDSSIAAKRNVKFVAWKLYSMVRNGNDCTPMNMNVGLNELHKMGFEVVPFVCCVDPNTYDLVVATIKSYCENMKYPIDGIVFAFDDIEYGNSLGSTGHHPKHSLAYKFYQETNETILRDIEWSTSRTGVINPVAVFDPVEIDGTTVSRASLSNVSIIKELELGIGDTITVIKANQIIPKITDNLTRSGTYKIPTKCPTCGSPAKLRSENGREMLYCTNDNCKAKLVDKIKNFCSRDGMNITGLSEERIKDLVDAGFLKSCVDIYHLPNVKDKLESRDGYGTTSVKNLLDAIEVSRTQFLSNVIYALGIPGVGVSAAKVIAECAEDEYKRNFLTEHPFCSIWYNPLDCFISLALNNFDWSMIKDIGEKMKNGINLYVKSNYNELRRLDDQISTISENKSQSNALAGKTFCITGKLYDYRNRAALVKIIESYGGKVVSGITEKTDYLIANDKKSGSQKTIQAKERGVTLISEKEFLKILNR